MKFPVGWYETYFSELAPAQIVRARRSNVYCSSVLLWHVLGCHVMLVVSIGYEMQGDR